MDLIAIITAFGSLDDAIAAARRLTKVRAGIAILPVTIVAGLPGLADPITTAGEFTGVGTHVVVPFVAVITFLTELQKSVTTARSLAMRRAIIVVDLIAVIAVFMRLLDDTVATIPQGAVIETFIGLQAVAIITGLRLLPDPVAAAGETTG